MRKFPLYICLLLAFNGCSQKAKYTINQNEHINADNIVSEIEKQIKHYPSEKIYKLSFENYYCFFEAYINDILVFTNFQRPLTGSAFEINSAVFGSGVQKVNYKLYPVGKIEDDDVSYDTFPSIAYFGLILKSYDIKNKSADDIEYLKYKTPSTRIPSPENPYDTINKFEGAGKTYYEGGFTINVDVPYELDAKFLQAQDLRKMDPKQLEAKLLKEYEKVRDIYQSKDLDNIANLAYDKLLFEFVSTYEKPGEVDKAWKGAIQNITDNSFQMQPIENYKMEFFADGRLVALMSKSQDKVLRGEPALWAKYRDEDSLQAYTMKHYFYIPHGETEFKVY